MEDNFSSDRDKSYCIDANYSKTGAKPHHYKDKYRRQLVNKPIKVGMNVEEVKIRKHEVDEKALQKLLRSAKKESKKTIKDISKECNVPLTKAEHWFRTDSSFAIPKDTVWIKLKFVLGITTNEFDKALLEFEYRDGVFESTQRVYSDQGKSPTLTASNKEQMIETKKEYISKQSVEKYVEDVNAEFNDPYNKKTVKGNKSTTLRTNSSNGNMWVNEKAIRETKPKMVGKTDTPGHDILKRVYSEDGKSPTITAHAGKGTVPKIETKPKQVGIATDINGHDILKRVYSPDGKSPTVTACSGRNNEPKVVTGGAFRGRAYDKDGKRMDKDGVSVANKTKQMLELRKDEKSNAITTVGKDSVVAHEDLTWRKLTPLECERLQTVPDNYTNHVSNTQRYKMLGNGWTVEVIKHIFKNMEVE